MTFENNSNQEFEVLKVAGKNKSGNSKFLIRFSETGYERIVEKVEIKRGKIKDKLAKSVFGVGVLGEVKMVDFKREYSVWSGMLERCYDPNCHSYQRYGGRGITVCERWHTFTNFLEDLRDIEGFDEDLFYKGKIYIDKDIKQKDIVLKVYSPDTCVFVSLQENNAAIDYEHRKKSCYAMSPEGKIQEVKGINEFARQNNLIKQGVYNCLRGKNKTHKGWKFSYRKEDI
ncbi:hypothetical protein [Bacillus infantis]|uniref:hypothetical protein n=1 Tax=Bacillus infantis TaxID=324767 RepID=UPI003CEC0278